MSEMVTTVDAQVTTAQVTTAQVMTAQVMTAQVTTAMVTTADALVTTETVPGSGVVQVVTVPLGPASLVLAVTVDGGVLGCGAIDPGPLGRFGIAAARVRPTTAPSVACVADLLAGVVTEANAVAQARGVVDGMAGEAALRLL